MDEVLQLLRQLYILCTKDNEAGGGGDWTSAESATSSSSSPEMFMSKKITNKLVQQIQDPLVLSADALPDWCKELSFSCPMLFPFETRLLHFHCTAFGASRWVDLEFCEFCVTPHSPAAKFERRFQGRHENASLQSFEMSPHFDISGERVLIPLEASLWVGS